MMLMSRCDPFRVWSFTATTQLTVLIIFLACFKQSICWHMNYNPSRQNKDRSDESLEMQKFEGDPYSPDYFKLLATDGNSVIVGARNFLYNISLITLKENRKIEWFSPQSAVDACLSKQKTAEECQNFIRVAAKLPSPNLMVCGTNAFDPKCQIYRSLPENSTPGYIEAGLQGQQLGIAKCPYDPAHNSTAVYVDGTLYSATYADFLARDALIFAEPIRTEQYDSKWLNEPNFVSSFEYQDKIYFFYRETAVEYINCGKVVYSRVARICKNDHGGNRVLRDVFTSFFKSRLNCSIPGDFPFYFNEIQSTTDIGSGNVGATSHALYRNDMIYGVFTTPENSIPGSAICAYRFSDILKTFQGIFKEQLKATSAWLPRDPPSPHPEKCTNDTKQIPDQTLNFIKSHVLMDGAIPAFGGEPLFIQTSYKWRFTQIAVDWQVRAADRNFYDIMFIGTDDGRILKVVNKGHNRAVDTIVLDEYDVFKNRSAIVNLMIYKNEKPSMEKLVVMSKYQIRSVPLHRCHLQRTCTACVALQDPYCSWFDNQCSNVDYGIQNISSGISKQCKDYEPLTHPVTTTETTTVTSPPTCAPCNCPTTVGEMTNEIPGVTQPNIGQYSAKTLAVALALSVLLALVLGIIVGYRIAMCRRTRRSDKKFSETYQKNEMDRDSHMNRNDKYNTSPQPKQLNLVLNVKPKSNSGKFPNGSAETKPVHHNKMKKVYV